MYLTKGCHLKSRRIRKSNLPNRNRVRALSHVPYLNSTRNWASGVGVYGTHARGS
ncbi:hypothetical protein [Neisseria sicca]|uniref:hypothetical protein n=1 Tax=Neisseria sicca TaxID=490 RepID=UPI0016499F3E|nr:hypothetical protein [Neisseria sicca]